MPHVVPLGWRCNPGLDATGPDGQPAGPLLRLHPAEVISWGMEFAGELSRSPTTKWLPAWSRV